MANLSWFVHPKESNIFWLIIKISYLLLSLKRNIVKLSLQCFRVNLGGERAKRCARFTFNWRKPKSC